MQPLELSDFSKSNSSPKIFERSQLPYNFVVDSHLHFKPFGGEAIPFDTLVGYLKKAGVLFANVYGIGQILPSTSPCTYYLDCPGTPVSPSTQNDLKNAEDYLNSANKNDVHLVLSMSFPDLANPQGIADTMLDYEAKSPDLFNWVGEVNLIKQALLMNNHMAATRKNIEEWQCFMQLLKKRGSPINIHCDMGNDDEPTKFLELMHYVLELYPNNKIVWAHMGLSKEFVCSMEHAHIVGDMLDIYPNLMVDISWRVLEDNYFSKSPIREKYIELFNEYHDRVLTGTDFVASADKTCANYEEELEVNSRINQYLSDQAFRNIALGNNYFRLMELNFEAPQITST